MTLNESEKQRLLTELEDFCDELGWYRKLVLEKLALAKQGVKLGKEKEYERELQTLSMELQRKYGSLKEVIQKYGGPAVLLLQGGKYKCEVFLEMFSYTSFSPSALDAVMNTAIATVNIAIGNLQSPRLSKSIATGPALAPPKAFIAHGGKSPALTKLCELLSALNITPLVAEDAASQGRSVNEQVEWCLSNSDCAVILGTADDIELKDGKLYPKRNVYIEIGRVQERFPDKTIYLLEEGASFPSNISEKVYERFTQGNMEKAFIKAVKELSVFGILRAEKTRG
jgi:predicted nucleotide-binding protein